MCNVSIVTNVIIEHKVHDAYIEYKHFPWFKNIPNTTMEFMKSNTKLTKTITQKLLFKTISTDSFFWTLQKQGTAIGTKFAPSYAILFMGDFEELEALEKLRGVRKVSFGFVGDM